MRNVEVDELERDTAALVAAATNGETLIVTKNGVQVAILAGLPLSPLEEMIAAGLARPARRSLSAISAPEPARSGGPTLSELLAADRADQRY